MVCGNTYESRNIQCVNCVCEIPNAKKICTVQDDRNLHRNRDRPSKLFKILYQKGNSEYEVRRKKDCNVSIKVNYDTAQSVTPRYNERRMIPGKRISVVDPTAQKTTRKRILVVDPTAQKTTRQFKTLPSFTDHQHKEVCGKSSYKNAFYTTLITALVVLSCICLALAAYFTRKRLRRLRKKSTQILQSRPDEIIFNLDRMQSENYSYYATIEDTFDLKAMEHYTTVSEPHYAEPLQSDSLHDDTETNPSFPETRKTAVNRNVQNQGFQQDLLKLCKSNYHEDMNQMESQQSQESYISDIHKHRTCDSRLLRHSEYSSEYFQLEPKDMNDDNINQENSFSPKNEYFQLEVSSKGTKKHVNAIEDQIILGSESNECSTHCAQDISETTTPTLSVNEHLDSSTNVLTSMTDAHRTNDESSLIMQTEGNATDNRPHECHMKSRSNAPDDGSGYFVLLKRKDFPDQQ